MKKYTFESRLDTLNFLDNHNFKYYVPRLKEYMSNIKDDLKHYYIELSNSNEVNYCAIVSLTEGKEFKEDFFDINKVDEFKDTAYDKKFREKKYQEGIDKGYF